MGDQKQQAEKFDFYPFTHDALIAAGAVAKDGTRIAVVRGPFALCGYTAIPKGKLPVEWHGDYNADGLCFLAVHGGITYCHVESTHVVFGLDCGHAGDEEDDKLRDPSYVANLALEMQRLLLAYAKVIKQWRAAGRKKRCTMLDKINADYGPSTKKLGFCAMISLLSGAKEMGTR